MVPDRRRLPKRIRMLRPIHALRTNEPSSKAEREGEQHRGCNRQDPDHCWQSPARLLQPGARARRCTARPARRVDRDVRWARRDPLLRWGCGGRGPSRDRCCAEAGDRRGGLAAPRDSRVQRRHEWRPQERPGLGLARAGQDPGGKARRGHGRVYRREWRARWDRIGGPDPRPHALERARDTSSPFRLRHERSTTTWPCSTRESAPRSPGWSPSSPTALASPLPWPPDALLRIEGRARKDMGARSRSGNGPIPERGWRMIGGSWGSPAAPGREPPASVPAQ